MGALGRRVGGVSVASWFPWLVRRGAGIVGVRLAGKDAVRERDGGVRRLRGTIAACRDDLYERDVLAWSESQAALPRRLARGERVNDVDWAHVVEELEDVGLAELHAVESFLCLILVHLLKLRAWPDDLSARHWRVEVVASQQNAEQRFAPSMRQRIDLARLYRDAIDQLEAGQADGAPPLVLPAACPFTLEQLLTEALGELVATARSSAGE